MQGANTDRLVKADVQLAEVQTFTVTVCEPGGNETGQENVPLIGSAVVVHRVAPFGPVISTRLPGVAVPETVGDVEAIGALGFNVRLAGGTTAVKLAVVVPQPTDVQAVAVSVVLPGDRVTGQLHKPPAVAVVLQSVAPFGSVSVTRLLGVAVPDTVGDVLAVPLLAGLTIATVGKPIVTQTR